MSDAPHDMYYENTPSRSPGVHRLQPQTLQRQPSRQFDAYGQLGSQMPTGLYQNSSATATPMIDDHNARFDGPRYNDRLNTTMQNNYGYDMSSLGGWNANAFSQSNSLATVGAATTRLKPNPRPRNALPPVR